MLTLGFAALTLARRRNLSSKRSKCKLSRLKRRHLRRKEHVCSKATLNKVSNNNKFTNRCGPVCPFFSFRSALSYDTSPLIFSDEAAILLSLSVAGICTVSTDWSECGSVARTSEGPVRERGPCTEDN